MDGDRLRTQFTSEGDWLSAWVTDPNGGNRCYLGPYASDCLLGAAGAYQVVVELYFRSGAATYRLGVDSTRTPSACPTLPAEFFSFASAPRVGALAAGQAAACFAFDQPAGAVLRLRGPAVSGDVRGEIRDSADAAVCGFLGGNCKLTGTGPYRVFLYESYGAQGQYSVGMPRLSDPTGCRPLAVAGFGDPGAATGTGTLAGYGGEDCYAVAAGAGRYEMRVAPSARPTTWSMYDNAGQPVCEKWVGYGHCDLPNTGPFTLFMTNTDWTAQTYRVAVTDLAATAGCAEAIGTAWNQPTRVLSQTSGVQTNCLRLDARPGERVVAYLSPTVYDDVRWWITDGTGAEICPDDYQQIGCQLPGSGPYRIVSYLMGMEAEAEQPAKTYEAQVGSVSAPVGCPTVTPGSYGTPPPAAGIRCRMLSAPKAGRYLFENRSDESNYRIFGAVYDRDGHSVCDKWCDLPAAGEYLMVLGQVSATYPNDHRYRTAFFAPDGPGCVAVSDSAANLAPYRGEFRASGQYDCLRVPSPRGARLALTYPQNARDVAVPDVWVVDATGRYQCDWEQTTRGACTLSGEAPFRILTTAREHYETGGYTVAAVRTDAPAGCPTLPQGRFDDSVGATVTLSAERYAACLAIPANAHGAAELVAATGGARLSLFDAAGARACTVTRSPGTCQMRPGEAYLMLVEGPAAAGAYRVIRRDVTSGAGCLPVSSTTLGTRSGPGTLDNPVDVRCFHLPASAADQFWVDTRDAGNVTRYEVYDAAGDVMNCGGFGPCRVTGSAGYQILVRNTATADAAVRFELDAWRIPPTAGGAPPGCPLVPSVAYGFGPLEGVLTADHPARCVALPLRRLDSLSVTDVDGVTPYMITEQGITACAFGSGGRACTPPYRTDDTPPVLFVLAPTSGTADLPYRVEATCGTPLCGRVPFAVGSVSPSTGAAGTEATITLRGSSLHRQDEVRLTRSGQTPVTARVESVSADRTTLTANLDLTGAAPGSWTLTVRSYAGAETSLAGGFTVTPAALVATAPPTITGTVRVGGTLQATTGTWSTTPTAYAYQWYVDGQALAGATGSLLWLSSSLEGRQLTVTVTAIAPGAAAGTATSTPVKVPALVVTAPPPVRRPR